MNPLPSSESSQDTTESKGSSFQEIKKSAAPVMSTYMQSDTSSNDDILGDEFGSLSDTQDFKDAYKEVQEKAREVHGIASDEERQNETENEEENPAEATEQEAENETVKKSENTTQPLDNIMQVLRDNTIPILHGITVEAPQDINIQSSQDDTILTSQDHTNRTAPDNSNHAAQGTTENLTKKPKHMIEKYMNTRINYKIRIIDKNFGIFDGVLRKIDEFHNLHFEEILMYINPLDMDSYGDEGYSIYLDQIQINSQDIMSFEVKEKVHTRLPRSCKMKASYKRPFELLSTSDSDSDFIPLSTSVSQPKKPNNGSSRKPSNGPGPSKELP